jgi:uncharacterized membrane protein
MSENAWLAVAVLVLCLLFAAAGAACGVIYGVRSTTAEAQRAAILVGAAKWEADKETGDPRFEWARCAALWVVK